MRLQGPSRCTLTGVPPPRGGQRLQPFGPCWQGCAGCARPSRWWCVRSPPHRLPLIRSTTRCARRNRRRSARCCRTRVLRRGRLRARPIRSSSAQRAVCWRPPSRSRRTRARNRRLRCSWRRVSGQRAAVPAWRCRTFASRLRSISRAATWSSGRLGMKCPRLRVSRSSAAGFGWSEKVSRPVR